MSSSEESREHLGIIKNANILIIPSPNFEKSINYSSNSNFLKEFQTKTVLSIGDIKELWKLLRDTENNGENSDKIYLNQVLSGSEIKIPKREIPEKNPELVARLNKLKRELERKEYENMTKNVDFSKKYRQEDTIGYQMREMNAGLIGIFQFIVSVGAAFLFGFMGVELFITVPSELAVKILLGIIFALIVAIAELYFLATSLNHTPSLSKSKSSIDQNISNSSADGIKSMSSISQKNKTKTSTSVGKNGLVKNSTCDDENNDKKKLKVS